MERATEKKSIPIILLANYTSVIILRSPNRRLSKLKSRYTFWEPTYPPLRPLRRRLIYYVRTGNRKVSKGKRRNANEIFSQLEQHRYTPRRQIKWNGEISPEILHLSLFTCCVTGLMIILSLFAFWPSVPISVLLSPPLASAPLRCWGFYIRVPRRITWRRSSFVTYRKALTSTHFPNLLSFR